MSLEDWSSSGKLDAMTENELALASREELIAVIQRQETLIAEQQTLIAALQVRISALEHKLSGRNGPGMPGLKPARGKAPAPKERKRREKGYGRPRLPPTETVQHVVERCPTCQMTLLKGWVQATREVIEIPLAPVQVIE